MVSFRPLPEESGAAMATLKNANPDSTEIAALFIGPPSNSSLARFDESRYITEPASVGNHIVSCLGPVLQSKGSDQPPLRAMKRNLKMIEEGNQTDSSARNARQLDRQGYVILEAILDQQQLSKWRAVLDRLLTRERERPFEPTDGPSRPEDRELEAYLAESYNVSKLELQRVMRRIRHTRASNYDTPWPGGPREMNKTFLHIPNLFDRDRSQYVRNLPAKTELSDGVLEHPSILGLARHLLGNDCILGDLSAVSIGPGSVGGAWHLDNPLTQLPEPLPDFPLGIQVAWMIDDFRRENGATRVVPESHLTRRKPGWKKGEQPAELALEAPAGSVAIWLGSTWHRAGPNQTAHPRRALISFYQRAWIKPFSEYRPCISPERARQMSPTVRYLCGFSAYGLVRG